MALVFMDSFAHYNNAQGTRKWNTWAYNNPTSGRFGFGINYGTMTKTLDQEYATLTWGRAFKTSALAGVPFGFYNALSGLRIQCQLAGDGRFFFTSSPNNNSWPGASTFSVRGDEWYYLECKVHAWLTGTPHGLGTVHMEGELRVNEGLVLQDNFDAVDVTYDTYAGHCNFSWIQPTGAWGSEIADMYLTDGEYLGDIKTGVLYPSAAGDSAQWVPSPAQANYLNVKEHPVDDDATTNTSANAGDTDLYQPDHVPAGFSGIIKGVQALWLLKKSDAGSAVVRGQWKSGGVEESPDFYPSALNYLYAIDPQRKSKFTGNDWTIAELNGLQLGIKRTV